MLRTVDVNFNSNSRPRNRTTQIGSQAGHGSPGTGRPVLRKLQEFEQLALYDTSVSFGLFALIDTVLASLGEINHVDPDIQDFCRENVNKLGGLGDSSTPLYSAFYKILHSTMWAGFSVTENLYKIENGSLWLDDFVTYHPASIIIRPNRKGRLTEGEETDTTYKSGIYQSGGGFNQAEKLLPLWKITRLARSEMYGNYYGISLLESVYKWCVLKDALLDMMAVALDRFGNPIVALTFPLYNTDQTKDDGEGGQAPMTTQELLEEQIRNNQFSGGGNVLLLPQVDEKMKPSAQVLTTGNNVGGSFLEAIANCDREISKGLLVPYGLLSNDGNVSGEATQQQMEMFNRILKAVYKQSIQSIIGQSFHRLVKMNFTRESAKVAPTIAYKQNSRPEDRVSLMQVISGLTSNGYLNPTNKADWHLIREMVDTDTRPMDSKDDAFIKAMLITPREKTPGASSGGSNPSRAKGTAGTKGAGVGAGRPVGTSAPKN